VIGFVLAISWHQARRSGESFTGKMPGEFPWTLCSMLIDPLCGMGWLHSGTEFVIHDKEKLQARLPHYFKHNKMDSFKRQLNYWGFRTKVGSWVFSHPRFRADSGADEIAQLKRKPNKGNNETRALKRQAQALQAQALQAVPKKRTRDETLMPNKKPRTGGQKFCIDSVLLNIESTVEDGTGFIRFNTDVIPVITSNCGDTIANISPGQDSIPGQTNGRECEVKSELDAVFDEYSSSTNTHDGVAMMIDALNTLIEDPQEQMVKYDFDEHVHLERGVRNSLKTPMAPSLNFPQMYADYNRAD
jgi:hypothetical protein